MIVFLFQFSFHVIVLSVLHAVYSVFNFYIHFISIFSFQFFPFTHHKGGPVLWRVPANACLRVSRGHQSSSPISFFFRFHINQVISISVSISVSITVYMIANISMINSLVVSESIFNDVISSIWTSPSSDPGAIAIPLDLWHAGVPNHSATESPLSLLFNANLIFSMEKIFVYH